MEVSWINPLPKPHPLSFIVQGCMRRRTTSVNSEPILKGEKPSPGPRRRVTWSHDTEHLRRGLRPRRVTVTVYTGFTKIATPPRRRTSRSSKRPEIDTLAEDPEVSNPGMSLLQLGKDCPSKLILVRSGLSYFMWHQSLQCKFPSQR